MYHCNISWYATSGNTRICVGKQLHLNSSIYEQKNVLVSINPKPLQSVFFWSPVWFSSKNVTIQFFFSILAPQTRLLWIGFKTTLKRTTVRIFQIKSQNIFFLFVKKTVFRKRIFMLLLLRKSITDVPVHRDWGTFGILCLSVGFTWGEKFSNISLTGPVESNTAGMGQVSNLWKKKKEWGYSRG